MVCCHVATCLSVQASSHVFECHSVPACVPLWKCLCVSVFMAIAPNGYCLPGGLCNFCVQRQCVKQRGRDLRFVCAGARQRRVRQSIGGLCGNQFACVCGAMVRVRVHVCVCLYVSLSVPVCLRVHVPVPVSALSVCAVLCVSRVDVNMCRDCVNCVCESVHLCAGGAVTLPFYCTLSDQRGQPTTTTVLQR